MTVSTTAYAAIGVGNGATTVFSFSFIPDNTDTIQVTYTNVSGVATVLNPSAYTLFINPPAIGSLWGVGGTVTYPLSGSPIPTGSTLTIQRVVPYTQNVSISNQGAFYPQAVEQGLDLLELQLQQLTGAEPLDVRAPISDGAIDMTLPTKTARASMYLGFDANGLPVAIPGSTAFPVDLSNFTSITTGTTTAKSLASRFSYIITPQDFGAVGNGVADDTAALQAWLTAVGTGTYSGAIVGPGAGFLPAGIYKYTSTLTIPVSAYIFGVPSKSVLRPSGAVTTAAVIQSAGSTLRGVVIDGLNAGNIIGLSIGASGLTNNGATYQVLSVRFTNGAAQALKVVTGVIWSFEDCYFGDSVTGANIIDSGQGTPTTLTFKTCLFKGNSQIGLQVLTGQECQFLSCIFEQNGSLGSYCNVSAGGGGFATINNILFQACYWEANQTNTPAGAGRHALFNAYFRGDDIKIRDCFFSNGTGHTAFTNEARAFQLDNANEYVVDHNDVANEVGQISIIGGSSGTFVNWIDLCGDFVNTVTDGSAYGATRFIYEKHGVFTPSIVFAVAGDLSIAYVANGQIGRFQRVGNKVKVQVYLKTSTFTYTTASGNLSIIGLPFTSKTVTNGDAIGSLSYQGITKANYTTWVPHIGSATTAVGIYGSGSGQTQVSLTAADMPSAGTVILQFNLEYEIANAP